MDNLVGMTAATDVGSNSKQQMIRTVAKKYWVFAGGFLLCFGPFVAMLTLQSSINIEESVGTMAMGLAYAVSVAAGLFIAPVAIRRIGTKWVMMLGEFTYLTYIAANFYPKRWIMVTAGIAVGIGEALVWTVLPIYLWHFGHFHGISGSKNFEVYVQKYTGIFYAVLQIAQIFGSSLSYGILYGSKYKNESNTALIDENLTNYMTEDFEYCGANDCQNPNLTRDQIVQYIPANSLSLFILIGIFCALAASGTVFHAFFLPHAATRHSVDTGNARERSNEAELLPVSPNATIVSSHGKRNLSYWSSLQATFKHAVGVKQVLLVPLLLYIGLENTIILAEAPRSFVSCVLGVEQIGMVVIPFAVMNGTVSVMVPKLIGKLGRNKLMAVTLGLDICNYTFCLLWKPTSDTKYLVYVIFFAFAISEPMWKNCTIDIYTHYFPQDQEISFAVWNAWITIGLALGFLWSPLLCVDAKIYVQIGLVVFSVLFYAVAEFITRREDRRDYPSAK